MTRRERSPLAPDDPIGAPSSAAPERRRTLASLGSRNYRLFFFGQTISQVGNWLTMVALTLLILRRTDSGVAVGALSACQFGPVLVVRR